MKTYHVMTTVSLERMYTVQASSEEDAKQKAKAGKYTSHEDLELSEEVLSVETDEK